MVPIWLAALADMLGPTAQTQSEIVNLFLVHKTLSEIVNLLLGLQRPGGTRLLYTQTWPNTYIACKYIMTQTRSHVPHYILHTDSLGPHPTVHRLSSADLS
jgi:hypothetical protein